MQFAVEGRYFTDAIQAFTFAQIQADRMKRAVEVFLQRAPDTASNTKSPSHSYHATAHPSNYVRRHFVTESP